MSDDEYNKRKGTLRDWERQQKAKDSTFTLAKHAREHREMADARRQAKLGLPLPAGYRIPTRWIHSPRCFKEPEPRTDTLCQCGNDAFNDHQ